MAPVQHYKVVLFLAVALVAAAAEEEVKIADKIEAAFNTASAAVKADPDGPSTGLFETIFGKALRESTGQAAYDSTGDYYIPPLEAAFNQAYSAAKSVEDYRDHEAQYAAFHAAFSKAIAAMSSEPKSYPFQGQGQGSLVTAGDVDCNTTIKTGCADTPYPETCVSILSTQNFMYQCNDASNPRVLAGMAIYAAIPLLDYAFPTADTQTQVHDLSEAESLCFATYANETHNASQILKKTIVNDADFYILSRPKLTDASKFFAEAKEKHIEWNCDECRHGELKKEVDGLSKGSDLDKFMHVLPALIQRARAQNN